MGPVFPAPIAFPSGPQSTVAAAFSHAIRPVANAAHASVQRFSDVDIWPMSKRRCRVETLKRPRLAMRPSQTTSITAPMVNAIVGVAVLSTGERSADPAHAAIGSAQITLLKA